MQEKSNPAESEEQAEGQTELNETPETVTEKSAGEYVKAFVHKYFIVAFSGMALGLFCTLIAGTIVGQIGWLIGDNPVGRVISYMGTAAKTVMGAGGARALGD